jgi:hypothetical protein
MKNILTYILVAIALFFASTTRASAQEVADASATLKTATYEGFDYRVEKLRTFLFKLDSPLAPYADNFVTDADNFGLDYRLVPSISGVESTFGKRIPSKSFNAYGWANGKYNFKSWPDSIKIVSSTLKYKYIDRGAPTISKIARRYAPPSSTWSGKVKFFIAKIDVLPLDFDII